VKHSLENFMNTLLIKGCWNIAKGKARQKLARWTADTIEFSEGKRDELTGRIQKRKALGTSEAVPASAGCQGGCRVQ
jgi:uncharacterized protein YjbJ (UPF0337 family)